MSARPEDLRRSGAGGRRNVRRTLLPIVMIVALAALAIGARPTGGPAVTRKAAYPSQLPEGAGRGIAQRSCQTCHSAMLITQQHKDSTGWEKTVAQMEKWGVRLSPAERDSLGRYLRLHFMADAKR